MFSKILTVRTAILGIFIGALLVIPGCAPTSTQSDVQDLQNRVKDLEHQLEEMGAVSNSGGAQGTHAEIAGSIAAIYIVDSVGLHGIDDAANKEERIDATKLSAVRKAVAVTKAAPWPEKLKHDSEAVAKSLSELEKAIAANDLTSVKGAAKDAHERAHDFSNEVYAWLSGAKAESH